MERDLPWLHRSTGRCQHTPYDGLKPKIREAIIELHFLPLVEVGGNQGAADVVGGTGVWKNGKSMGAKQFFQAEGDNAFAGELHYFGC